MKQYLETTRSPWHSFLFVVPLFVLYQVAIGMANLWSGRGVVNGADALIQGTLGMLGIHGPLVTTLVLAVVAGVLCYRADAARGRAKPHWRYFLPMLAESAVYALFFGTLVGTIVAAVLPRGGLLQIGGGVSFAQNLAVGLGAGLYEELVFRLLLTGGLLWAFRKTKWKPGAAVFAAVLVSSLIFSLFHYIGPLGDPFRLGSFLFRFVAGMVLAGLFSARGFAVAAWTHSLYDVFLLFAGGWR